MYVSIRPEKIMKVDAETRQRILLETAESTWKRLNNMKTALSMPDASAIELTEKGMTKEEAEGIIESTAFYGAPESSRYLKLIQNALRIMLPDKDIDLGLPEDVSDMPDEITVDGTSADKEEMILETLSLLDKDGRGAALDELTRKANDDGISDAELEAIVSSLMDKGLVYEPVINRLKRI
jgi:hypothetical protein